MTFNSNHPAIEALTRGRMEDISRSGHGRGLHYSHRLSSNTFTRQAAASVIANVSSTPPPAGFDIVSIAGASGDSISGVPANIFPARRGGFRTRLRLKSAGPVGGPHPAGTMSIHEKGIRRDRP
jgi:hypothetical protein